MNPYDFRKRQVDFSPRKSIKPYIVIGILIVLLVSILIGLLIFQPASAQDGEHPTPTIPVGWWIDHPAFQGGQAYCYNEDGLSYPTCISIQLYYELYPLPTPTPDPAYPGPNTEPYPEPIVAYPGIEPYGGVMAVPDVQEQTPTILKQVIQRIETWIVSLGNKRDKSK